MTTLAITTKGPASLPVDALVVGAVATDDGAALAEGHGLPKGAVAHLATVLRDLEAKGEPEEVARVVAVPGVKATSVVVTGIGRVDGAPTPDQLRRAASVALRAVATKRTVAVALPAATVEALGAVAEGAFGGCYTYAKPSPAPRPSAGRRSKRAETGGPEIQVCSSVGGGKEAKAAVERAAVLGAARDWARDLVNMPPNLLYPATFVDAVTERVAGSSGEVTVSVLDEKALAEGGFGGIVGVGQGSARPPRIVTMSYSPKRSGRRGAKAEGGLALVGKGITFDSGGVNIKTAAGMVTMKSDMAGAAAVAAAVVAAAELQLPTPVTGYLCLAENMPSGTAQRPSDVVTMRNGTTVEILDTDAEGRMVLADGICLAAEASPAAIVDIATLTGAQMVALGWAIAGAMANDDTFRDQVVAAGDSAGEPSWPMPLPADLRKGLDTPVADIAHKAERWGGMLTAGLFLQEFVPEGTPWAHLDIAGPSFNERTPHSTAPKGGTGFGVGTLVALAESMA